MNLRTRLARLEASGKTDPYAGLDEDLWPLVGSRYTHDEWVTIMEEDDERCRNES